MRPLRHAGCVLLAVLSLFASGCGRPVMSAAGIVQFVDGEVVQSGSIEFRSRADAARYASRIASDGTFTLTNSDGDVGCPPGEYDVVVVQIVLTEDLAAEAHEHGRTVPRRYADYYTSGLRMTIPADSAELLQIKLD